MAYDLHVHSDASDGLLSPQELIELAVKKDLTGLAITDHDTIEGIGVAINYLQQKGYALDYIPAIELNAEYEEEETHILGYFIDYKNQALHKRLQEIKTQRFKRAEEMIFKLNKLGLNIELEEVKKIAQSDLIARPHIARALCNKKYVANIREAFDKYLSKGKVAYVARYKFSPKEAIEMIKMCGGLSFIAHPALIKSNEVFKKLLQMGIDGIEVYYPEHNFLETEHYKKICQENDLLLSGGSDFHGFASGESRADFAQITICKHEIEKIKQKLAYNNT